MQKLESGSSGEPKLYFRAKTLVVSNLPNNGW